jgi:L-ascorbate metabolism protein UlaG (beta-lactamase superfamily)
VFSEQALSVDKLTYLDDIVITHVHPDHCSPTLLPKLVEKFPEVRITAPQEVVDRLEEWGITQASTVPPEELELFDSPHEAVEPLFPTPQQIGVHYLDMLSHPGDGHSFTQTKQILALPVAGPWASTIRAAKLAIELKPKYVLPIHDWHWSDAARTQQYDILKEALAHEDITFVPLVTGEPVVIDS